MTTIEVRTQRIVVNPPSGRVEVFGYGVDGPPARVPITSSAPVSPEVGDMWLDSDDNKMYIWNGSVWVRPSRFVEELQGTTMPASVNSYPSHVVRRQGGTVEGGQINLEGGTSHPAEVFIDRIGDTIRLYSDGGLPITAAKNLVAITSTDDVTVNTTDDFSVEAGDTILLRSGGDSNIQVTASGVGLGVGATDRLYLNNRTGYLPIAVYDVFATASQTAATGFQWITGMGGLAIGNVQIGDKFIINGVAHAYCNPATYDVHAVEFTIHDGVSYVNPGRAARWRCRQLDTDLMLSLCLSHQAARAGMYTFGMGHSVAPGGTGYQVVGGSGTMTNMMIQHWGIR